MSKCSRCGRPTAKEDLVRCTAAGHLGGPGAKPTCSPCFYRACHPTKEPAVWIVRSLVAGFSALTAQQRARLRAYVQKQGAKLAVGRHFYSKYWIYKGIPRIPVVAAGRLPRTKTISTPETAWVNLNLRMEAAADRAAGKDPLSFDVAVRDATLAQVREALSKRAPRRKKKPKPTDPLDALDDFL